MSHKQYYFHVWRSYKSCVQMRPHREQGDTLLNRKIHHYTKDGVLASVKSESAHNTYNGSLVGNTDSLITKMHHTQGITLMHK